MPGRISKFCSTPTGGWPAVSRTRSNGPRSWLPWPASASRRCVSTPSAWARTTRPGLAAQIPLPVAEGQGPLDAILAFFEKPLRFRGLLALAEEDEVASQLHDQELKNAASQIRALSAAAHQSAAA
ncbi:MAG TPA: hypothetical protein VIK18_21960 [Pirellulales bacterium]